LNREDIIRMAREAGLPEAIIEMTPVAFERFAALVAAAEREACAKVCDDRVTAYRYATDPWAQEHIDEARHLAKAIRARGQI
jgi:mitochondrial fission protein ELM1